MLKEKELREFCSTYQFSKGEEMTLQRIQDEIEKKSQQYEVPIAFYGEQIKSGGILNSTIDDCIVIYHPEHQKDYYKIAVCIRYQGKIAFVSFNDFGESKNLKKLSARNAAGSAVKQGWSNAGRNGNYSPGMSLTMGLMGGAIGALRSIGGSKAKQEAENNYYAALMQIIDEVMR